MAKMQYQKPGEFCWLELYTPDAVKAVEYYGNLFGWTVESMGNEGTPYTMLVNQQQPFAGLVELNDELKELGTQPGWNAYVLVNDADSIVVLAESLDAEIIMPPFDVFDAGRMAVLADPTGAVFSIWQSFKEGSPAAPRDVAGFPAWNELLTTNVNRAKKFYTTLFGWTAETKTMPNGLDYTTFNVGETQVAGLMEFTKECKNKNPNWGVYFAVANCDTSVAKATKAGGQLLFEPIEIPDVGRFAALKDPQGVCFSVFQNNKVRKKA